MPFRAMYNECRPQEPGNILNFFDVEVTKSIKVEIKLI